jgi:hypothetical protein
MDHDETTNARGKMKIGDRVRLTSDGIFTFGHRDALKFNAGTRGTFTNHAHGRNAEGVRMIRVLIDGQRTPETYSPKFWELAMDFQGIDQ